MEQKLIKYKTVLVVFVFYNMWYIIDLSYYLHWQPPFSFRDSVFALIILIGYLILLFYLIENME